jgi:hypothetical protein
MLGFEGLTMLEVQKDLELFRPRSRTVSWKMPAMFCNDWAALRAAQILSHITDEAVFDRVYGAPRCAWAGGRPSAVNLELDEAGVRRYFEAYKQVGTTCALTISRIEVDKSLLSDPYCNMLLDLLDEYDGEAILFDDDLAEYVRKTHPGIRRIGSLNKAMSDYKDNFAGHKSEGAYYRDYLELYDEVVIRCEFASDDELLESVSDVSDRCEIIVNQFCMNDCTQVYRHVKAIEDWNHGNHAGQPQGCFHLEALKDMDYRLCHNLFMSESRINYLVDHGFTKLKLAGRNSPLPKFLDMVSQYVFEPTGAIQIVKNEVMREFRLLSGQRPPAASGPRQPPAASGSREAPINCRWLENRAMRTRVRERDLSAICFNRRFPRPVRRG